MFFRAPPTPPQTRRLSGHVFGSPTAPWGWGSCARCAGHRSRSRAGSKPMLSSRWRHRLVSSCPEGRGAQLRWCDLAESRGERGEGGRWWCHGRCPLARSLRRFPGRAASRWFGPASLSGTALDVGVVPSPPRAVGGRVRDPVGLQPETCRVCLLVSLMRCLGPSHPVSRADVAPGGLSVSTVGRPASSCCSRVSSRRDRQRVQSQPYLSGSPKEEGARPSHKASETSQGVRNRGLSPAGARPDHKKVAF